MYSLIKMLYWMCERCDRPPTGRQFEHAIKRNFGGYFDTYSIFVANQLGNMSDDVKIENKEVSICCQVFLICVNPLNAERFF